MNCSQKKFHYETATYIHQRVSSVIDHKSFFYIQDSNVFIQLQQKYRATIYRRQNIKLFHTNKKVREGEMVVRFKGWSKPSLYTLWAATASHCFRLLLKAPCFVGFKASFYNDVSQCKSKKGLVLLYAQLMHCCKASCLESQNWVITRRQAVSALLPTELTVHESLCSDKRMEAWQWPLKRLSSSLSWWSRDIWRSASKRGYMAQRRVMHQLRWVKWGMTMSLCSCLRQFQTPWIWGMRAWQSDNKSRLGKNAAICHLLYSAYSYWNTWCWSCSLQKKSESNFQ